MMSGSSPHTPDVPRKVESFITPEMAVVQIYSILYLCIKENPHILTQKLKAAFDEYNLNFPIINTQLIYREGEERKFNIDELKEHVLQVLVPQLSADNKTYNLAAKLIDAASAWPSQKQYLAQKREREKEALNSYLLGPVVKPILNSRMSLKLNDSPESTKHRRKRINSKK